MNFYKLPLRAFFLGLMALALTGCLKNEMTITFELSSDVDTSCRIVYYASAKKGGTLKESFARISEGKASMKLPQGYPSIMYLFPNSGSTRPSALIYGRRGDKIVVTGKGADISGWEIRGNDVTEQLTEWRLSHKGVIAGGNEEKLNSAVADFVKKNPDSKAAAILLYVYFTRGAHENEFASLWASLGKKVRNDKDLMNALSAADLLTGAVEEPKYNSEIVLTGEEGYADTIRLGKGSSTMLMFVANNKNSEEKLSTDSLKSFIAKRNGKTVAELYADSDSLAWRRHLANDSVSGMKRLWMPLGVVDSLSISMGVRKLPYYIVIDSKGKDAYRGESFKEASAKFQSLTP